MKKIRVLLADDHPVVRQGMHALLKQTNDLVVIGEASNGAEVIPLVTETQPDILLLDMVMPDLSGVEVARQLKAGKSAIRVLGFSSFEDSSFVRTLLQNGAAGYLLKSEAPELLVEAIRGVARGEDGWYSRRAAAKMGSWLQQNQEKSHALTARELDVLALLVAGKSNQEIATNLNISEKTVEKHIHTLFTKFNVTSRVEAAVYAVKQGFV